jgi:hypothetical protein
MPEQLKVKAARQASLTRQILLTLIFVVPIFYLLGLARRHRPLHFADPAANLVAHAMLFFVPVAWATLVTAGEIEFVQPPGELLKSAQFRSAWWQSILFYPSLALGIFFTLDSAWRILSGTASPPATPAGEAAFTMVLAWIFALLLSLKAKAYKKVWILPEGLHVGLGRFVRWDEIHHVRWQGRNVDLFHKDCRVIPTMGINVTDDTSLNALKQKLSNLQIPDANSVPPALVLTQCVVAVLSVAIFSLGLAARFLGEIDTRLVVSAALAVGIAAMWLLEKIYVPSATRMKRPAIVKES